MHKEKKKIGILFGGCSTEYEVSLQSAFSVITHMDMGKYTPVLIGLEKKSGTWYWYQGNAEHILDDTWFLQKKCIPVFPSTDRSLHGFYYLEDGSLHSLILDAVFPVLHGKNGEDGTVQGLLKLAGIPVIGCDILSSAVGMDKEMAHQVVSAAGIKVPKSVVFHKDTPEEKIKSAAAALMYPVFVKPDRSGSSFGITKVTGEENLLPAVEKAFEHDNLVLLEENIPGFEVGCAVLGCNNLIVGEIDEIELSEGFFDYTEKYTMKTSKIHVPARISKEKARELKEAAKKIYRLLHCSFFARVDMFLTPDGEIYFNEVNTIPGFTVHSRYPNMMKEAGISFDKVIDMLLEMREE